MRSNRIIAGLAPNPGLFGFKETVVIMWFYVAVIKSSCICIWGLMVPRTLISHSMVGSLRFVSRSVILRSAPWLQCPLPFSSSKYSGIYANATMSQETEKTTILLVDTSQQNAWKSLSKISWLMAPWHRPRSAYILESPWHCGWSPGPLMLFIYSNRFKLLMK